MPGDLLSLLCWQVIIHITKCSPSCVPGYSLHPPVSRSPYNTLPGPAALPGGTLSRQMWAHIASFPLPQGERTPFFPSNTKKQEKRYHFPPPIHTPLWLIGLSVVFHSTAWGEINTVSGGCELLACKQLNHEAHCAVNPDLAVCLGCLLHLSSM